jgi:hypothetical protein
VNEFDNPFIIQTDPFFDTYIETLEVLAGLGLLFDYKQRLPIFKVCLELQKLGPSDDVDEALELLDMLRELMARGLEPEHDGIYYV